MPIYEYQCKKCSAEFERLRSMAEMDKASACPKCKSRATRRKVSMQFAVGAGSGGDFGDFGDFGGDDMGGDDFDDF